MCTPLRTINDSLSHRRRYMVSANAAANADANVEADAQANRLLPRSSPVLCLLQKHNFPINYTLRVQAEELLRPSTLSRMVGSS